MSEDDKKTPTDAPADTGATGGDTSTDDAAANKSAAMQDSTFKKWYDAVAQRGSDAMKSSSEFIASNYNALKDRLDYDQDGNVTLKEGGQAISDGLKSGYDSAKAALSNAKEYVFGSTEEEGLWGKFSKNPSNFLMAGMGALLFGLLFGGESMIGVVIAALIGAAIMGGIGMFMQKEETHVHIDGQDQERSKGLGKARSAADDLTVALEKDKEIDSKEFSAIMASYNAEEKAKAEKAQTAFVQNPAQLPDGHVMLTPQANLETGELGPIIYAQKSPEGQLLNPQVALDGKNFVKLGGEFADSAAVLVAASKATKLNAEELKNPDVQIDDVSAPLIATAQQAQAAKKAAAEAAGPSK